MEYNVNVNDIYIPFLSDNHRYAVIYGGSGSGKSVACAQKLVLRCINETGTKDEPSFRHNFAVIRKFKTTVKDSVYAEIKIAIDSFGLSRYVKCNDSYHEFKFMNGARIFCCGLDDQEKIKSIRLTGIWMEEATEFEERDFDQLTLRLRGKMPYYKQIILSFNPIDESHWIKAKLFDNRIDKFTYTLFSNYKDNHHLDEQYKEMLEEQFRYNKNMYRIYVLGEWGRVETGSEYYFNFSYDKHVVQNVSYISGYPLHISFDFNVNPYISATVGQIYRRTMTDGKSYYFVRIIDEFALENPHNTTERLCEHIIKKYENELKQGVYIYGDATGKNKSTKSNISDYDIIEYYFRKYMNNASMRVPKANPMIKKRRNFINKLLYGGFNIEYQISPNCKKLINDFQVAIEEQDGSKKKQMAKDPLSHVIYEKNGHHADCNDYFLCQAFDRYYDTM